MLEELKKMRFKLTRDAGWTSGAVDREWLWRIDCRNGGAGAHLYRLGKTDVGFMGRTAPVKQKLFRIPGVTIWQDGDKEYAFRFNISLLPTVAKIVSAKKKRQPPRQDVIEAGKATLALLHASRKAQAQGPNKDL